MKKWLVTMPIAGSVSFEVETEDGADESAAIEAAWRKVDRAGIDDETLEYELFEEICEGNICHAPVHSAFAEKVGED